MFKLRLADYINQNMLERDMTYKELHDLSGVPDSSLHSYAQAKVNNPNEENLIRIAAAFGDPPEVIQRMRRESMESSAKENRIIAESNDKERMEEFAALIRSNVVQLLEEFRVQSAAQQTEIIQHADKRIADAEQKCSKRVEAIRAECIEHEATHKQHFAELLQAKIESFEKVNAQNDASKAYLRMLVRNLSIALSIVGILAVSFGMYAVFAYRTFDINDPTQGLSRHDQTAAPFVLLLVLICVLIGFGGKLVFTKKMLTEKKDEI